MGYNLYYDDYRKLFMDQKNSKNASEILYAIN